MSTPLIAKILEASTRHQHGELAADEALLQIVAAAIVQQSKDETDEGVLDSLGQLGPVVNVLAGIEVQLRRTANALIKVPVKVTAEQALKAWPEHLRIGEEYVVQFLKDLGIEVDE